MRLSTITLLAAAGCAGGGVYSLDQDDTGEAASSPYQGSFDTQDESELPTIEVDGLRVEVCASVDAPDQVAGPLSVHGVVADLGILDQAGRPLTDAATQLGGGSCTGGQLRHVGVRDEQGQLWHFAYGMFDSDGRQVLTSMTLDLGDAVEVSFSSASDTEAAGELVFRTDDTMLAAFLGAPDIWDASHQDPLGGLEIRPGLSYGISETSCGVQEFTELEFHGDELVVTEVGDRTAVYVHGTRYNLQHGNSWTLQSEQACTDGATSRMDWALWR